MKYKEVLTTQPVVRNRGSGVGRFVIIFVLLSVIGGALVVMMTQSHARRHSEHVKDIPDKCNSGHYEVHMFRPADDRNAYLCFVEGYFVISIFNFTQEMIEKWGDNEVTAFARPSAKTMQDVIDYMVSKGYQVLP